MARTNSNPFTLNVTNPSSPAWLAGMAVGQWKELPGTNLSAIATADWFPTNVVDGFAFEGPDSSFNGWNGASADTRTSTLWKIADGGHTSYYGNQAVKLRLSADVPVWQLARTLTPPALIDCQARLYLDGRPSACHSYYMQQFCETRNRAMRFVSYAVSGSGNEHFPNVIGFDINGGDYDPDGTYPDYPGPIGDGSFYGAGIAKHPSTQDVYVLHAQALRRWNQATNAWIFMAQGASVPWPASAPMCVDDRRNRLFFCGTPRNGGVWGPSTFDLTTLVGQEISLTGGGAAALVSGPYSGMSFVKHPTNSALDQYLFRKSEAGGTVYTINGATLAAEVFATTGGDAIPLPGSTGIHSRWQWMPQLGVMVIAPKYSTNAWVLRVL